MAYVTLIHFDTIRQALNADAVCGFQLLLTDFARNVALHIEKLQAACRTLQCYACY
jgi:hypothetical protein